ncbi:MAG TPA: NERD domain-containing protein [Solirubrobacteraceae bacterium]
MQRKLRLRRTRVTAPAPPDRDEDAARRTQAVLDKLDAREWTALAAIDPRHHVDQVLVGPGGVFVLASHKPHGPAARVRDGVLWLRQAGDTRSERPRVAINRHVLDAARLLHGEIRRRSGRGPTVHAVVVLWCEFPQGVAQSSQLAFVHGRNLTAWLAQHPAQLDQPGRALVVQTLRALRDCSAQPPHLPHLPHVGPRHRAA